MLKRSGPKPQRAKLVALHFNDAEIRAYRVKKALEAGPVSPPVDGSQGED